ncbi:MAG: site-specific integrase [Actinomycetota bacterium]|nr:site-specific integrase [Actinomycetota bacterium]
MTGAPLWRRLLAELLGSAFLATVVIGSGIAARHRAGSGRSSRRRGRWRCWSICGRCPAGLRRSGWGWVWWPRQEATAAATLRVPRDADAGPARALDAIVEEAVGLGYARVPARNSMRPLVGRLLLAAGHGDPARLGDADLAACRSALGEFGKRKDVTDFYDGAAGFTGRAEELRAHLHRLAVVLYHRGQLCEAPSLVRPAYARRPAGPPAMERVVVRYLAARRLDARPNTVGKIELGVPRFLGFLAGHAPQIEQWDQVGREDALAFAAHLDQATGFRSGHPLRTGDQGRPLSSLTKRSLLCAISVFSTDVASWGWPDGPARPLLGAGDLPKMPRRVPRYIPGYELSQLMAAVAGLPDVYQRAALLIPRWSGARRAEIRRLEIDCLDSYPDGTPRLRLPAGKTRRERMIPVHPEAARAIGAVQAASTTPATAAGTAKPNATRPSSPASKGC